MATREAMFIFLRSIGLHPLEWDEMVEATGKASPYIGEVLEAGFARAQAIVILMTPDDEARLRSPYRQNHDPAYETKLTPQARPNVLIEAGMALGLNADRTVLVEIGQLRPASDLGGRHVVRMSNSPKTRKTLAQRLEKAGCGVNMRGNDWLEVGDFDAALPPASASDTDVLLDADRIISAMGDLLKSQRDEPRPAAPPRDERTSEYSFERLRGILASLIKAYTNNEIYIPELLIAQREMQKASREVEIAVLRQWASFSKDDQDLEPSYIERGIQARKRLKEMGVPYGQDSAGG